MYFPKLMISTLFAILFSNIVYADTAPKQAEDCPVETVTTAYLTYTFKVQEGENIGEQYAAYMKAVNSLPATGNFNNFKITQQQVRYSSPYQRHDTPEVHIQVTIEFDLNYLAVTNIVEKVKLTSMDVTTFDQKQCQ